MFYLGNLTICGEIVGGGEWRYTGEVDKKSWFSLSSGVEIHTYFYS